MDLENNGYELRHLQKNNEVDYTTGVSNKEKKKRGQQKCSY